MLANHPIIVNRFSKTTHVGNLANACMQTAGLDNKNTVQKIHDY